MSGVNLINAICDRIKLDKEKLEHNELGRIEIENFCLSEFWSQFGAAVQSLNNQVTKIGFICGKKPFPSKVDLDSMLQTMSQHYNMVKEFFMVLPPDEGAVLYKAVTSSLISIMSSLFDFVKSLHNLTEKGAKDRLTLTGQFWDSCSAVDILPKDNLQATLQVLGNEVNLASDAKEELETTLKEDDEGNDESWTDSERELAKNALGLTKVTHVCVKWLRDAVRKQGSLASTDDLDVAASIGSTVSPALDNFVSELYHPVDFPTVYEMAEKLVQVLRSLLTTMKGTHFAVAFSSENISKLEQFISHNHQKVDPSAAAVPQLASLCLNSSHVEGHEA
ncbi:cyclin-D1-binding protein 1 homolog [Macrosteles quadrilineatus]|uniref:cyclin-D1-binding protein 1 homolog n=1 Tax=Macrosteles quadrilineatus TaxID=74068 RepID=UPI0023E26BE6|nr:cyclin-D1-binding protein 1 homolog [Macrosteles quadrilineatus]